MQIEVQRAMTTATVNPRDPKFLGFWTKCIRESLNWSQEALAAASSLTVRTIQRIEAGKPVNRMTRQALARGLGYENYDIFDDPTFIRAIEDLFASQAIVRGEELRKQHPDHLTLPTMRVTTGEALLRLACEAQGQVGHVDDAVPPEVKESAATLFDYLRDLADIHSDLSYADKLKCNRELDAAITELEELGSACYIAERQTKIVEPNWADKTPMAWKVGYLLVVTKDVHPTEIMVPRRMTLS